MMIRFIPAHAGNSCSTACAAWQRPVHPRARGEQDEPALQAALQAGSSPRTRGTGLGAAP